MERTLTMETALNLSLTIEKEYRLLQHDVDTYKRNLSDFYLLLLTIITFIMQMAFSIMEIGLVRTKNTTNVTLKSTMDAFVGCISYWLVGFAFAWSEGNAFIGWNHFAFVDLPPDKVSLAFYQLIFSNTASTIVTGAVAERFNLPGYFLYGTILTGVTYPLLSRWGWYDSGWLKTLGFRDFGGSGLVHMFSGTCALVAAKFIGPRTGRFAPKVKNELENQHHQHIPGHSIPLLGMGILVMVFGFLGFNISSNLSIVAEGDGTVITYAGFNTFLSGMTAAVSALFFDRFLPVGGGHWSYVNMANGALIGMAAACAGCDSMSLWGGCFTGIIAGGALIGGRYLLEKYQIDDPIDAWPIHGLGGMVGILTSPFLITDGIFRKHDAHSFAILGCNMLGTMVIIIWALLWCVPIFAFLKWSGTLRVPLDMELDGLDVPKHNEFSHDISAWTDDFLSPLLDSETRDNNWVGQNYREAILRQQEADSLAKARKRIRKSSPYPTISSDSL